MLRARPLVYGAPAARRSLRAYLAHGYWRRWRSGPGRCSPPGRCCSAGRPGRPVGAQRPGGGGRAGAGGLPAWPSPSTTASCSTTPASTRGVLDRHLREQHPGHVAGVRGRDHARPADGLRAVLQRDPAGGGRGARGGAGNGGDFLRLRLGARGAGALLHRGRRPPPGCGSAGRWSSPGPARAARRCAREAGALDRDRAGHDALARARGLLEGFATGPDSTAVGAPLGLGLVALVLGARVVKLGRAPSPAGRRRRRRRRSARAAPRPRWRRRARQLRGARARRAAFERDRHRVGVAQSSGWRASASSAGSRTLATHDRVAPREHRHGLDERRAPPPRRAGRRGRARSRACRRATRAERELVVAVDVDAARGRRARARRAAAPRREGATSRSTRRRTRARRSGRRARRRTRRPRSAPSSATSSSVPPAQAAALRRPGVEQAAHVAVLLDAVLVAHRPPEPRGRAPVDLADVVVGRVVADRLELGAEAERAARAAARLAEAAAARRRARAGARRRGRGRRAARRPRPARWYQAPSPSGPVARTPTGGRT